MMCRHYLFRLAGAFLWENLTLRLAAGIQLVWPSSALTSLGASRWDWRLHVTVRQYVYLVRVEASYPISIASFCSNVGGGVKWSSYVLVLIEASRDQLTTLPSGFLQCAMLSGLDYEIKTLSPTYRIMLLRALQIEIWDRQEACLLQRCSRYGHLHKTYLVL